MKIRTEIDLHHLGKAIVDFLSGKRATLFMPYEIMSSSLSGLPDKINVNLSAKPLIQETIKTEEIDMYDGISITFSRHEIFQAITK